MIIIRSPVRLSLFGGSTDYESYYTKYGPVIIIGVALTKYCYIHINRHHFYKSKYIVRYSKAEEANNVQEIQNPAIRGVLEYSKFTDRLSINIYSDLPAQTGLGSSSAAIVGLLKELGPHPNSKYLLSKDAVFIERKLLKEPGGIQDQIWSAYGGINSITINTDGNFFVRPLPVSENFIEEWKKSSIIFYMGHQRQSFDIARSHDINDNFYKRSIKNRAYMAYEYIKNEDLQNMAMTLDLSWQDKRKLSDLISTPEIDNFIQELKDSGAWAAKLMGAGGTGFVYCMVSPAKREKLVNLIDIPYFFPDFDLEGAKTISV